MAPSLNFNLGRRSGTDVVGLDIQPGLVAAVQARVNGSIVAERAAALPLPPDTVREGDVVDEATLGESLRELFASGRLGKRVRVGVANQRTVMRTLELPPVTDQKELAAAVAFQAQDQVPMPLNNAVTDFHPLGVVDTPAGPRQVVVLVAAQRDMIERLLAAVRGAGLQVEGVDLSAFALIRSLYRKDSEHDARVMYLNVDGLTNLAIAEGTVCRFTRVVGGGLEGIASELAERMGVPMTEARAHLSRVDLTARVGGALEMASAAGASPAASQEGSGTDPEGPQEPAGANGPGEAGEGSEKAPADWELAQQSDYSESYSGQTSPTEQGAGGEEARLVLENGIREISGEVRNSLDFHRSQDGGGEVSRIVLSGAALDLPGFAQALQTSLGVEVQADSIGVADQSVENQVSTHRLAVAAGLATTEAPE
jgi:type IV pilus assembly protein PilM